MATARRLGLAPGFGTRREPATDPPLFRAVLWAYPRSFREEYGPDMAQLFADRRRQDGRRASGLLVAETVDCLRTHPDYIWRIP